METPEQRAKRILAKDQSDKELEKARCALYLASTQFTHCLSLESLNQLIEAVNAQSDLYQKHDFGVHNIELLLRLMRRLSFSDLALGRCDYAIAKLAQQARIKTYDNLIAYCASFGSVHPMVTLSEPDLAKWNTQTAQQNMV